MFDATTHLAKRQVFRVGDAVECVITNRSYYDTPTLGATYKVLATHEGPQRDQMITVEIAPGRKSVLYSWRFTIKESNELRHHNPAAA